MVSKSKLIRSHADFVTIINKVKAEYILSGKKVPSTSTITRKIAKSLSDNVLREVVRSK